MPNEPVPCILIADDLPDVLEALRFLIKGEGYQCEAAQSPAGVMEAVEARDFDAVVMDLNYTRDTTSGQEGLDLLHRIQALDPTPARGRDDRLGQRRPGGRSHAARRPRLHPEALGQRASARHRPDPDRTGPGPAPGASAWKRRTALLRAEGCPNLIAAIGRHAAGAGAHLARRPLRCQRPHHRARTAPAKAWWPRPCTRCPLAPRNRPLVTVNTGGLSEGVFESELFGHVKGAFTDAKTDRVGRFELADGGTLFLDEIANMPLRPCRPSCCACSRPANSSASARRRPRRVDVRVISATNAELHAEVAAGRFRQDLLFRLNTIEMHLPPLRERREDIPLLATHFLRPARAALPQGHRPVSTRPPSKALLAHPWPGNVRELDHAVERAVLMAQGEHGQGARPRAAACARRRGAAPRRHEPGGSGGLLIKKALARFERQRQPSRRARSASAAARFTGGSSGTGCEGLMRKTNWPRMNTDQRRLKRHYRRPSAFIGGQ